MVKILKQNKLIITSINTDLILEQTVLDIHRRLPKGVAVVFLLYYPRNTRGYTNAALFLAHRRRRWANNKPALGERLAFAVKCEAAQGSKQDAVLTDEETISWGRTRRQRQLY